MPGLAMRIPLAAATTAALLFAAACGSETPLGPTATPTAEVAVSVTEVLPKRGTVSGTVTYAENIPLTSGAKLEVSLIEFYAYLGAGSGVRSLINSKTIPNPGQVPIAYDMRYTPYNDDNSGESYRTYIVRALIFEADGRLAFSGEGRFDGDSPGGVARVDIHMSLEEPPPELVAQLSGGEWSGMRNTWVKTPAKIVSAIYIVRPPDSTPRHVAEVVYSYSTVPDCVGNWPDGDVKVRGAEVAVTIMLWEPPPLPWDTGCGEEVQEVLLSLPIQDKLQPGERYTLTANGEVFSTFTVP